MSHFFINFNTIFDDEGDLLDIEMLIEFKVEGIGKEYIAYTINYDSLNEEVNLFISKIWYENDYQRLFL